jgi:hypothetical protein
LPEPAEHGRSFSILAGLGSIETGAAMPSLLRFLAVVAILGGLTYGVIFALATWVDPKPREITVSVPQDRFAKQP